MNTRTVLILNIEPHLKEKGLTKRELAKRIGKSKAYISLLKRAKCINLDVLGDLLDALELDSLDDLFVKAKVEDKTKRQKQT